MEHDKTTLNIKYPIIRKISGFISAVIAIVLAIEWNRATGSYWGFLFLVIAVPGLLLPFIHGILNLKRFLKRHQVK
ncbi:MAG: hypothetical protein ACM34K_02485 [Bacillota bacterium]